VVRVLVVEDDLKLAATHLAWRGPAQVDLSAKEFALLEAFMRRPGEVLSRYELLEHAWPYEYENRSNIIEVYVRNLREKIDRRSAATACRPFEESVIDYARTTDRAAQTAADPR
jgi:DNA-binding response OmpR family regulator